MLPNSDSKKSREQLSQKVLSSGWGGSQSQILCITLEIGTSILIFFHSALALLDSYTIFMCLAVSIQTHDPNIHDFSGIDTECVKDMHQIK